MEPDQKRTPDTSSSVQTSSDKVNTSRDKIPLSPSQLPLTKSIVDELPLCMLPPPQLQSQQHTIEFGESDVEDMFNGADDKQNMTENWWDLVNKPPPPKKKKC